MKAFDEDVQGRKDRFGRSALHLAALHGAIGLCRMLIHHGAELNDQEAAGNTALHLAVLNWQNLLIRAASAFEMSFLL